MDDEKNLVEVEVVTFDDLKEMEEVVSGSSVGPILCCNS